MQPHLGGFVGATFQSGGAHERYGPKPAGIRQWILSGALGEGVIHCGCVVHVDAAKLDARGQCAYGFAQILS